MRPAAARLILTVVLFLGWLGYLTYLVICRPHTPSGLLGAFEGRPLTLSRPQFLVSPLDVIAEVSGDKGEKVVVKEVLFPKSHPPVKVGEEIQIENIGSCRPLSDPLAKNANPPPDYSGPGLYLLPLQPAGGGNSHRFEVVPTPPSPGFPTAQGVNVGPPRIYPATEEMRAQYREIAKPKEKNYSYLFGVPVPAKTPRIASLVDVQTVWKIAPIPTVGPYAPLRGQPVPTPPHTAIEALYKYCNTHLMGQSLAVWAM